MTALGKYRLVVLALVLGGNWTASVVRAQGTPAPATAAPSHAETAPGPEADPPPARPAADGDAPEPALPVDPHQADTVAPAEPAEAAPIKLSPAELASLGVTAENPAVDTSFHFSGFMDFTVTVPIKPNAGLALGTSRYTTFYVGNVNLYVSKNLSEAFRTMAEVRFTYLPNGSTGGTAADLSTTNTVVRDYAEAGRLQRWGGIIMQRVYLEWTMHGLATLRAGQFLTPYGIWNVDHGSPAYIPVQRPYVINNYVFPERQTGFELFGRGDVGNYTTLGYHVTLSNGTGPVSEYRDLDRNKAVGGRVYWEFRRLGILRVGASGYYGSETTSSTAVTLNGTKLQATEKIEQQFDALALGADVLFKYKGLHVQVEWASVQRRFTRAGRSEHAVLLGPVQRAFSQDALSWGGYGLLGYQLPWLALTPYVMPKYNAEVLITPPVGMYLRTFGIAAGFNLHPIDAVTVKVEYNHGKFLSASSLFGRPQNVIQFQAAWAF